MIVFGSPSTYRFYGNFVFRHPIFPVRDITGRSDGNTFLFEIWNFIRPCFSSLTGVRSASRMISTFTNLSSLTSSNSLAKKQKNYTFHFVIYHKHTCKKKNIISTFQFTTPSQQFHRRKSCRTLLAAIPPSEILTNPLLSPPKNIMFIVFLQFL